MVNRPLGMGWPGDGMHMGEVPRDWWGVRNSSVIGMGSSG